ncbi:hypothetical protein [Paenarthrobacter sp. NPDC058040]|uniref:hypothetical protein n=1 Tax=unclassified Paenarthrobacter TaxID=2634190 RepID=UPI0036DD1E09
MSKPSGTAFGIRVAVAAGLAGALLGLAAMGVYSGQDLSGAAYVELQDVANGGFRLGAGVSYLALLGTVLAAGFIAAVGSLLKARRTRSSEQKSCN